MKLPKSVTRVTPFSWMLAIILLFAFLMSAFYAGTLFQQKYAQLKIAPSTTPAISPGKISTTPSQTMSQFACNTDNDCVLTTSNTQNSCCPNLRCLRFADDGVIAVNASWLTSQLQAVCGRRMCPMIATMCTKGVLEENNHFSAKCVSNTCQKVGN